MAFVAGHLSLEALEAEYEGCEEVASSRHFQAIWLLAKGHTIGEVAEMTSFGSRWIEQLLARYNAFGPASLGDRRRGNGAQARVLKPELLERLRVRLDAGGLGRGRFVCGLGRYLRGAPPASPQRPKASDRLAALDLATAKVEDARHQRLSFLA